MEQNKNNNFDFYEEVKAQYIKAKNDYKNIYPTLLKTIITNVDRIIEQKAKNGEYFYYFNTLSALQDYCKNVEDFNNDYYLSIDEKKQLTKDVANYYSSLKFHVNYNLDSNNICNVWINWA